MMFKTSALPLLAAALAAETILKIFTVRVHTNISRYPWARLWYLCRGFDIDGSGYICLPIELCEYLLDTSRQSIYRWLEDGKAVGAFRKYRTKRGLLFIYLGSLTNVCWQLNIRSWGEVAEHPLWEVNEKIRAVTTGIITQSLQQKSRYAANLRLKPENRKVFGAPHPNELLEDERQSSLKSAEGEVPFVLHRSETKVFVSKSFTCFGASQEAIGQEIGIHEQTVRRHHSALGITKRQICQRKSEYAWIHRALEQDSPEFFAFDVNRPTQTTHIGYQSNGETVRFVDGIPMGAKKQTPNEYVVDMPADDFERRFFKCGGQWWLARCNVYREEFSLKTMRAARRKWRQKMNHKLSQCQFQPESAGGVCNLFKRDCSPTGI